MTCLLLKTKLPGLALSNKLLLAQARLRTSRFCPFMGLSTISAASPGPPLSFLVNWCEIGASSQVIMCLHLLLH